jgi:hypothetical protein
VALWEYDSFEAVASALGRGRLELGFAHNPTPDDRVESILLLDDSWVILTRRDSPLAEIEHPSFDVLDGADVVAWNRKWQVQAELEEVWMRRGIAPRIVYRTDDNLVLQRLVAAGLGHACIGRLAARRAIDSSLTWLTPKESSARGRSHSALHATARCPEPPPRSCRQSERRPLSKAVIGQSPYVPIPARNSRNSDSMMSQRSVIVTGAGGKVPPEGRNGTMFLGLRTVIYPAADLAASAVCVAAVREPGDSLLGVIENPQFELAAVKPTTKGPGR